jgi:hypothetical protein
MGLQVIPLKKSLDFLSLNIQAVADTGWTV